ncbi:MAG: hemin uptake protein HemP [Siculibacillus sp.]|nr:hemin uptake protein HemP [Siculibacillus sp.]
MIEDEYETMPDRRETRRETAPPVWDASQLTDGGREALIRHEGQFYRLRITTNRKLILTK